MASRAKNKRASGQGNAARLSRAALSLAARRWRRCRGASDSAALAHCPWRCPVGSVASGFAHTVLVKAPRFVYNNGMEQAIIRIIDQYGYVGVGFLIAVENLFPPIPSEIILTFGGFLTTFSALRPAGVIAAATVGAVAGGCVLYLLGRLLNKDRLIRLIESRPVKILRLKKEDIGRAEKWFALHGGKAVFFCRFVPIVRSLISIPAGMARMAPGAFLGLTAAGTLIWNTALVLLGRAAGGAWTTIAAYVDVYAMVAAACLALVLLGILAVFVKKRFFS